MIAAGTRLGSYEITGAIGAGGMGEVYEARDTKLGRSVAIKVLPEVVAHDTDRLARFQREARTLASLNHPNIATIHGLEQSNGTNYLVMELVPGETLADRVKAGPVPVEEALKIAVQIAEALEAAHEKNIIHRDLKPANVKVTPEGKVKVLDFGLAKAFEGDTPVEDISNSPTLSRAATMQGVILGTAAYMSPEQARGKAVDKRTDIWAFGCVLYELLTGKQAFQGEDITEILAAVVKTEPDWQALPTAVPTGLRNLLRRCLRKDKTLRMQAAGDVRIEIQEVLAAPSGEPNQTPLAIGFRALGRRAIFLGVGALLFGAAVVGLAVWFLKPSSPRPVTRTVINLPPGQQLAGLDIGPSVVLSPDGTRLAYVAIQGGTQQLYLRAMDSLEARPIPGTEEALEPFFSPDGQWLGFLADGKLKKVSVNGGPALTLGDAPALRGASWGKSGMIVFAPTATSGLQQISEAGGALRPLTHFEKGETSHRWPEFLPGSEAVLFVPGTAANYAQVAVQTVGSGQRRDLVQAGTNPHYASAGYLVYAQRGSLMAAPFDPDRLTVTGTAVPVVEGVVQSTTGAAQYAISENGALVYVPGGVSVTQRSLVWVGRNGTEQPSATPPHNYGYPRISPDGRRIALVLAEQGDQIWLYDLARDTLTRLTFQGSFNVLGPWTPDGKRIAFSSNKDGALNIFWQMADGSGGLERLATSEMVQIPQSWSPDRQLLAFTEFSPATGRDIWVLRMSDRKAQPFLQSPFNESHPQFSPDGHWIAYVSDESGRSEVYVQPYPGPGGKWLASRDGGTEPVWNRNGRELFYRIGNKMMAVEITTQPNFALGNPRMLFEGQYVLSVGASSNYDVSPDGQRFLMIKAVEQTQSAPTQINVVLNWFEELKQKVPTGKK